MDGRVSALLFQLGFLREPGGDALTLSAILDGEDWGIHWEITDH